MRQGYIRRGSLGGSFGEGSSSLLQPLPALKQSCIDSKQIQCFAESLVHDVQNRLRPMIERRGRREDYGAGGGAVEHQSQMARMERCFSSDQDKSATLFQAHIGGTRE